MLSWDDYTHSLCSISTSKDYLNVASFVKILLTTGNIDHNLQNLSSIFQVMFHKYDDKGLCPFKEVDKVKMFMLYLFG